MKHIPIWNVAFLMQSPLFAPLRPVLERLSDTEFPTILVWNTLLADRYPDVRVKSGHRLRFVAQDQGRQGFETQYEPRCYLSGEVQTREKNWHDLFNALVWLTFPKAKAAINARHYQALMHAAGAAGSQRGKVRDMATLLDESGVIVVCANGELAELLCSFQWKELFWRHREQVCSKMGFYIFGHGLYEKARQPYVGMTGQGLLLNVTVEFFSWSLQAQISYLDDSVATYLNNPAHCVSTQELHPVPLLGVPGWAIENGCEVYYENASYFRSGRQHAK